MKSNLKIMKMLSILSAILFAIILTACGGGGGGDGPTPTPTPTPTTYEAEGTIGPEGGVVEVTDPNSLLHGVKIEVPVGALDNETTISINIPSSTPPSPEGFSAGDSAIELLPSGLTFNTPVTITIPSNGDPQRIYYLYDNTEQVWRALDTFSYSDYVKVSTRHFSVINWLCRYVAGFINCTSFQPCATVTYSIDATTDNAPGYSEDQIKNAIKSAINTWQTALDGSLTFQETQDPGANIRFFWSSDGFFSFTLSGLLGHSAVALCYTDLWGNKLIKFNDTGDITWSADTNDYDPKISIEAFALHELGHALGLTHSCPDGSEDCQQCVSGPIMGPNAWIAWPPCTSLDTSDIDRIQQLYVCEGNDTEAPSVPTGLTATAVSSSQIDLSWTASTDDVGVTGYKVYRDGSYLKSVTTTSTSDTGLSSSTQYCYTVSAYDAAANEAGQSSEACATTSGGNGEAETISWQIKPSTMPTARSSHVAAVVGSDIYTLGGHGGSGTYSSYSGMRENEVYHSSTDNWEQMASIPYNRGCYSFATAAINNKIFMFGGANPPGSGHYDYINMYDVSSDTWTASVAELPYPLSGPAAAVYNGYIYLFGGRSGAESGSGQPYRKVAIKFDPDTYTYTDLAELPHYREGGKAFVLNNLTYLIGGTTATEASRPYGTTDNTPVVDVYNPSTDSWVTKGEVPIAGVPVLVNGTIYLIAQDLSSAYKYDVEEDSWSEISSQFTDTTGGFNGSSCFGVVGNKIYVLGGSSDSTLRLNTVIEGTVNPISSDTTPWRTIETIAVGYRPVHLECSSDGSYVYEINWGDSTLYIIDTSTNTVDQVVSLGFRPSYITLSPDGTLAYISRYHHDGYSVDIFDTTTRQLIGNISFSSYVSRTAISPDGSRLYVPHRADFFSIVDTSTKEIIGTFQGSDNFGQIAVSPDGSKIYTSNYSNNSICIVDSSTFDIVSTISLPNEPSALKVTPNGSNLFVNLSPDGVAIIDTTTYQIIKTLSTPVNAGDVDITPDGTFAFFSYTGPGSGSEPGSTTELGIYNIASEEMTTVEVGYRPYGLAVSPDSLRVYVANNGDETVSVVERTI